MAVLLGEEAVPHLKAALEHESEELVREQIRDLLGRWS